MFGSVVKLIENLTSSVMQLVTPIAVLSMVICGIMWVGSSDPQTSSKAKSWLIRILIGMAIVYLANTVVSAVATSMAGSAETAAVELARLVG